MAGESSTRRELLRKILTLGPLGALAGVLGANGTNGARPAAAMQTINDDLTVTGSLTVDGTGSSFAGNVGIGTTVPTGKLSVFDTYNSLSHLMSFGYLSVETHRAGRSNATGKFQFWQLTNNNGFNFVSSAPNATGILFAVGTSQLAVNGDTGNVGIGTNGPVYPLDVVGDIHLTGTLRMPASNTMEGTARQSYYAP